MSTQRILKGTSGQLSVTFYSDEAPVDADGVTVTVTATGTTGTIYASAAATNNTAVGVYRWTTGLLSTVDLITLVWTGTFGGIVQTATSYAEIVGGYYASLATIRATDPSFSDVNAWPAATLIEARAYAEEEAESIMGKSWVERVFTERLYSRRGRVVTSWKSIRSILALSVDGTALSTDELASFNLASNRYLQSGMVWGYWYDDAVIDITYTSCEFTAMPRQVVKVIADLARYHAQHSQSALPERSDRYTTDMSGRTFYLNSASGHKTAYPEVNAVLERFGAPGLA